MNDKELEEYVEKYGCVKNWFLKGNTGKGYTKATKKVHIQYLKAWCCITGLNPDKLATVNNIDKFRDIIAAGLRDRKGYKLRLDSIMERVNALNEFWRCNGKVIGDDPYRGIRPKLYQEMYMRKQTLTPIQLAKLFTA